MTRLEGWATPTGYPPVTGIGRPNAVEHFHTHPCPDGPGGGVQSSIDEDGTEWPYRWSCLHERHEHVPPQEPLPRRVLERVWRDEHPDR